jgi:hypothetical protein
MRIDEKCPSHLKFIYLWDPHNQTSLHLCTFEKDQTCHSKFMDLWIFDINDKCISHLEIVISWGFLYEWKCPSHPEFMCFDFFWTNENCTSYLEFTIIQNNQGNWHPTVGYVQICLKLPFWGNISRKYMQCHQSILIICRVINWRKIELR